MQKPATFWTIQAALLSPLALFWIGVVTGSEFIFRLLFGPVHTPFRDLLPVMILPSIALLLCFAKLRENASDKTRSAVLVLSSYIVLSLFIAAGYAIGENLRHAERAESATVVPL